MNTEQAQPTTFESWAIVELMGHRRLAGKVSEQQIAGTTLLRIDIPGPDGEEGITQFYGGGSIYCLTPTSEQIARAVAKHNQPQPVQSYELREMQQALPALQVHDDDDEYDPYNEDRDPDSESVYPDPDDYTLDEGDELDEDTQYDGHPF